MIYQYVVTLRNEKRRTVDIVSIMAVVVSAVAFSVMLIEQSPFNYIFLAAVVLIVAGLGYNIYNRRNPAGLKFGRLLLIAGLTWFAMPFAQWIGLLLLLLAFLERPAKLPLEVGFNEDRIVLNTIIRRRFSWDEMNNVMLKDGILTLDFKNNKLVQKETIDEEGDADEDEFNAWCRERLRV
jgi:hypothetical protein